MSQQPGSSNEETLNFIAQRKLLFKQYEKTLQAIQERIEPGKEIREINEKEIDSFSDDLKKIYKDLKILKKETGAQKLLNPQDLPRKNIIAASTNEAMINIEKVLDILNRAVVQRKLIRKLDEVGTDAKNLDSAWEVFSDRLRDCRPLLSSAEDQVSTLLNTF